MLNDVRTFAKPRRINIPFLLDLIIISEAELIKKIESSGDIDRLHSYNAESLPGWVKVYFRATKFYDDKRNLWFCPLEPTSNPTYQPRRNYLEEKVATSYSEEDVKKIAELLKTNADDEVLAHEMVQIVNQRFFDKEIPLEITKTAKHTVQSFSEALVPWKYSRGRKSQQQIMEYCEKNLSPDVHLLDVGHNIGEVVQATAGGLRKLKENLDRPVEEIFTSHPLTPQVPRIAIKASTFDGLLSSPTIPGKTVVILKIGEAAKKTQDINFAFAAGSSERVCVFKDFFLEFMGDLQQELKK